MEAHRNLMHQPQLAEFAQAIRERRQPAITVSDGRRVLKVLDAFIKSERSGAPVRIASARITSARLSGRRGILLAGEPGLDTFRYYHYHVLYSFDSIRLPLNRHSSSQPVSALIDGVFVDDELTR